MWKIHISLLLILISFKDVLLKYHAMKLFSSSSSILSSYCYHFVMIIAVPNYTVAYSFEYARGIFDKLIKLLLLYILFDTSNEQNVHKHYM